MSTPTIWNQHVTELNASTDQYQKMSTQKTEDKEGYYDAGGTLSTFNTMVANAKTTGNYDAVFLFFFMVVIASIDPEEGSNMTSMLENEQGVYAASADVLSSITQLNTDLQTVTNGTVQATPVELAYMLDQLDTLLKSAPVQAAVGEDQLATMIAEERKMRSMIYVGDATGKPAGWNSAATDPPQGSSGIFFNMSSSGQTTDPNAENFTLQSFDDMKKYMGQKGNLGNADGAAQGFDDSLAVMTTSGDSINAKLNQDINYIATREKTLLSMFSSMLKNWIDGISATQQFNTKGQK